MLTITVGSFSSLMTDPPIHARDCSKQIPLARFLSQFLSLFQCDEKNQVNKNHPETKVMDVIGSFLFLWLKIAILERILYEITNLLF